MRRLELSLKPDALLEYVSSQINTFFPDKSAIRKSDIYKCINTVLDRIEVSFSAITLPYYVKDKNSWFNYLHGDHYSVFLYLLSNDLYKNGNEKAAEKLFLLNKALFGVDAFYQIELPQHFIFVHPVGTILGRATYADFFIVYQGVTIGANSNGIYPVFKPETILYSNSSVIGSCKTGSSFVLGSNSFIVDTEIADNKVVVGAYPTHRILENKNNLIKKYFS
jgi:serine O-acetyltransferase